MKVAVYAICKDEETQVEGWAASCKDADFRIVADTGSKDDSCRLLRDLGAKVHNILVDPWSFGTALNTALALVPDADCVVRLDLDSRLSPGWRDAVEKAWCLPCKPQQLWYDYQFSPQLTFRGNHVHARKGFWWKGWDHEGLYPVGRPSAACGLKIIHKQSVKDRSGVLQRLEFQATEEPSARNLFYLGREYFYGLRPEGVGTLGAYLRHPDAVYGVERMHVCIMLGVLTQKASWFHKACAEYATRESYCALAEFLGTEALRAYGMTFNNRSWTIHDRPELWQ